MVATNVAETSLTIDGIRCVIDSGLARIPRYDPYRGINTLLIEKISRASADQRAGRAGRTAPGVCLRLWSRDEHGAPPAQELPEIKRLDLAEVVLTLKAAGVEDLRKFRWLEAARRRRRSTHAEELLTDLGALRPAHDPAGPLDITAVGRKMLAFPLHPRYARMLLAAQRLRLRPPGLPGRRADPGTRPAAAQRRTGDVSRSREDLLGDKAAAAISGSSCAPGIYAARQRLPASRPAAGSAFTCVTARQVGPLFQQFLDIARREGLDINDRPRPRTKRCRNAS